jgi:hypothetical protein
MEEKWMRWHPMEGAYLGRQEVIAAMLIGHAGDDGMIKCRYRQCQRTGQEWRH